MNDRSESKETMEVESMDTTPVVVASDATTEANKQSMDTTEANKNVMAPGTTGSVTCSLHPLVIMNVSEHWTRARAQAEGQIPQGKRIESSRHVLRR